MSILLEALKKSEQSRKLGETPTLGTQVDQPSQGSGSEGSLVPVLLIAISAIVMGWFGWQQFSAPEPVDSLVQPAIASKGEPSGPETVDASPDSRTMTENFEAAEQTASVVTVADADGAADEKQKLRQSVEQFVAEEDTAPTDEAESIRPGTETEAAGRPDGEDSAVPERAEQSTDQDLKPHISEPISYWELPQGVRDTLPVIKITVLVYAEEPDDRFVLTNGQRLVEKEELDSGLVLDEIRRDGAVFKYRKYRFLVKG